MTTDNLIITHAPHIEINDHIIRRMWVTFFALIPAGIAGIYIFGVRSFYIIFISIITALITEWIFQKLRGKDITILDGSVMITGLLLAYNLPTGAPFWI